MAAAIIATVRGIFKMVNAIRDNTSAVAEQSRVLTEYIHQNDTRSTVNEGDIKDLKDWRLKTEAANHTAALGAGKNGVI